MTAIVRARLLDVAGDWQSVVELEPDLSRLEPGEAPFAEASGLRIEWRLELLGQPGSIAEDQDVAETPRSEWREGLLARLEPGRAPRHGAGRTEGLPLSK